MESRIWDIGLTGRIIQDGQYRDFEVGQIAEFALEFFIPQGASAQASNANVSAKNLGGCLYETVAEVIVHSHQLTVLNIGVLAYQRKTSLPPGPWIAVQLNLGVDAFHNFSFTSEIGDVVPLVYSWRILSILRRMRDPRRLGYDEILKTDAWHDDGGHADYILRCELLPVPAKRESITAVP